MNENIEQISALIDDEEYSDHILDSLIKDQEMQKTWSRYHLIGDCLRGNLPDRISVDVASRVTHSLKSEPTVLAPQKSNFSTIRKPLAGFAIAASVAMVAVLGIQTNKNDDSIPTLSAVGTNSVATTKPVMATTPTEPQTFVFTEPQPQVLPAAVKKSDTPDAMMNQRMNNYLLNYNEYRSNAGMNGILPYVRIVTIESQE